MSLKAKLAALEKAGISFAHIPGGIYHIGWSGTCPIAVIPKDVDYQHLNAVDEADVETPDYYISTTLLTLDVWSELQSMFDVGSIISDDMLSDRLDDEYVIEMEPFLAASICDFLGISIPYYYEWEIAARGPHGSRYPWGDSLDLTSLELKRVELSHPEDSGDGAARSSGDVVFLSSFGPYRSAASPSGLTQLARFGREWNLTRDDFPLPEKVILRSLSDLGLMTAPAKNSLGLPDGGPAGASRAFSGPDLTCYASDKAIFPRAALRLVLREGETGKYRLRRARETDAAEIRRGLKWAVLSAKIAQAGAEAPAAESATRRAESAAESEAPRGAEGADSRPQGEPAPTPALAAEVLLWAGERHAGDGGGSRYFAGALPRQSPRCRWRLRLETAPGALHVASSGRPIACSERSWVVLDPASGAILRRHEYEDTVSSLAISRWTILAIAGDTLHATSLNSGTEMLKRPLAQEPRSAPSWVRFLRCGGDKILIAEIDRDELAVVLTAYIMGRTGAPSRELWQKELAPRHGADVPLIERSGKRVALPTSAGLEILDAETGSLLWTAPVSPGAGAARALLDPYGVVAVSFPDLWLFDLDGDKRAAMATQSWAGPVGAEQAAPDAGMAPEPIALAPDYALCLAAGSGGAAGRGLYRVVRETGVAAEIARFAARVWLCSADVIVLSDPVLRAIRPDGDELWRDERTEVASIASVAPGRGCLYVWTADGELSCLEE